jgi:hypothetical protein
MNCGVQVSFKAIKNFSEMLCYIFGTPQAKKCSRALIKCFTEELME